MPGKGHTLKFVQAIDVPEAEVYTAFTNATALCEWLCNIAQADAHEGGRLYLWWNSGYYVSGEFVRLKPGEKIVFSWHGRNEPGSSLVQVTLKPKKQLTEVHLDHTLPDRGEEWVQVAKEFKRSWNASLENLKAVLETGQDLRFMRRPMIGVSGVEELSEDVAARLNLDFTDGVRLDGVVDGMGAQAAGLQTDDVIVKIAGEKVTGINSLPRVLKDRYAGEKVKVIYYRDGKKFSTKLELSRRPIPDIPATADALLGEMEGIYAKIDTDLEKLFTDVTEEDASYKPAPDEWSAKEVLGHLIASERETHSWIASLIEGQEADFTFHSNLSTRVMAIVTAFPSLLEILGELRRNKAETMAMIAALPPDFVARKRSYWRLAYTLLESPLHYQAHFDQIQAVIAAYRG